MYTLALTVVLASNPAPVQTGVFACTSDARPLVTVVQYESTRGDDPRVPWRVSRSGTSICRDRMFVAAATLQSPAADRPNTAPIDFPFSVSAARGRLTPASYAALSEALQQARAGVLESCTLAELDDAESALQVTWFGRADRSNTFVIASPRLATGDEQPCGPAAQKLFRALMSLRFTVSDVFSLP